MKNLSSPIDLIKKSIEIFFQKENLIYFLKVYFFIFLSGFLLYLPQNLKKVPSYSDLVKNPTLTALVVVYVLIYVFIQLWTRVASYESVKRVTSGEDFDVKETFAKTLGLTPKFFVLTLLVGLITVVGLALLIVPGIVFYTWFFFSFFILINSKTSSIKEVLFQSKKMVSGRFWAILGRLLVFLIFIVLVQISLSYIPYQAGVYFSTFLGALFILPSYLLFQELKALT